MSKVDWNKTDWDPSLQKKHKLRPKGFGLPQAANSETQKDTVLSIYDEMTTGSYVSPLWPPPGDPRAAHPPTSRFRVVRNNDDNLGDV